MENLFSKSMYLLRVLKFPAHEAGNLTCVTSPHISFFDSSTSNIGKKRIWEKKFKKMKI